MLVFPEVFGGPGDFRKVREANCNNFLLFSSKSDLMVPIHDQKAKNANDKNSNDYFNV